jgi:hypothetical protein
MFGEKGAVVTLDDVTKEKSTPPAAAEFIRTTKCGPAESDQHYRRAAGSGSDQPTTSSLSWASIEPFSGAS